MEVLSGFSLKNFVRTGDRTLFSAIPALSYRPDAGFPNSKKLSFDNLVLSSGKTVCFTAKSLITSDAQVLTDFDGVMHGVQEIKPSGTVHVIFKLKKKCKFGDRFLLVGDDPMLGFWNPSCAVPMNWSAGDVWTAQMDIPIEMTLQFKFILRDINGEMTWQPGADRILKTWNCQNTIVVTETWDNSEAQKITEESLLQIEEQSIVSGFDQNDGNVNYDVITTTESINNPVVKNMNNAEKEKIAEAYTAMKKDEAIHNSNNPSNLYGANLVTMEDEKYLRRGDGC